VSLVLFRPGGGIGPDLAGGVGRIEQDRQHRAVMLRRVGDRPCTDEPVTAAGADIVKAKTCSDSQCLESCRVSPVR
jgi:hypothetical protein